jgi:hypothetical protein
LQEFGEGDATFASHQERIIIYRDDMIQQGGVKQKAVCVQAGITVAAPVSKG